jgi:acetyl-CoA acetyltransferase
MTAVHLAVTERFTRIEPPRTERTTDFWTGGAEHVLCFRTVWESTAQVRFGSRGATLAGRASRDDAARFDNESAQWNLPYGIAHACFGGLAMSRYLHRTGATREQIGQLAVVERRNAARNPAAVYREPLTLDDYLDARMISDPLCIYDCDVPIDGCVAAVISRRESLATDRGNAIAIRATGCASGMDESAEMMWSRTDLRAADVDVAEIYDGFSIDAIEWLEALGLCPRDQAGAFLEGGERISLDGALPLNTGGGQLSAGRMHGYGALLEGSVQLRGGGGARQVAPVPEVAVVSSGAGTFTSCLLLGAPDSP